MKQRYGMKIKEKWRNRTIENYIQNEEKKRAQNKNIHDIAKSWDCSEKNSKMLAYRVESHPYDLTFIHMIIHSYDHSFTFIHMSHPYDLTFILIFKTSTSEPSQLRVISVMFLNTDIEMTVQSILLAMSHQACKEDFKVVRVKCPLRRGCLLSEMCSFAVIRL